MAVNRCRASVLGLVVVGAIALGAPGCGRSAVVEHDVVVVARTPLVEASPGVLPRGDFASEWDWIVANGWGPTPHPER